MNNADTWYAIIAALLLFVACIGAVTCIFELCSKWLRSRE
jgi:hypothetical protein